MAIPAQFVVAVFEACLEVCDIILTIDSMANGQTAVNWGNVVSGTCMYYYENENGTKSLEIAPFKFSTSLHDGFAVISGAHLEVTSITGSSSVGTPQLVYNASGSPLYTINGNNVFRFERAVNGSYKYYISAVGLNGFPAAEDDTTLPTWKYNGTTTGNQYNIAYVDNTAFTTMQTIKNASPSAVYLPISGQNASYDDLRDDIADYFNDLILSETDTNGETVYTADDTLTIDDIPTWDYVLNPTESQTETETETETGGNGCNCDCTTIYVNADGSLTLQNEVSGNYDLTIDNNADLSLNVNAAAGAFGAGAIVVDPNANVNLNAGAFAAGAFAAGAIVDPEINISGNVNTSEITVSGGNINIDQSGATNNNTYNNYYYGTTEPIEPEQPFTIDYDEILSEGELESILNGETYELIPIETDIFEDLQIAETLPEQIQNLPAELVTTSNSVVDFGSQIVSELGLTPVYAPLLVFSLVCYILRGCA